MHEDEKDVDKVKKFWTRVKITISPSANNNWQSVTHSTLTLPSIAI